MDMKLPSWELAKELADALPGEKSSGKESGEGEGKPMEGKGSMCEIAERNKQSIRAMGGRI